MFDPPSLPEPPPGYEEFERNMYWNANTERITRDEWCVLAERKHAEGYGRVGSTRYGTLWVSTVWIGINMRMMWPLDGPPAIFETMVFCDTHDDRKCACEWDGYEMRYPTWTQAAAGHAEICSMVFKDVDIDALEVELLTGP